MLGEKNRRQFILMREQLNMLIANPDLLKQISGNMIFLRDAVDNIDEEWECEFNEQILNFESLSCATDEQIRKMGSSYDEILNESINKIDILISNVLKERDARLL